MAGLIERLNRSAAANRGKLRERYRACHRQNSGIDFERQAGVKLTIDPFQIPYSWCLTNACIATDLAAPKLIDEMSLARALSH
jgi:Invasion associated locus B (IalB) protein